MASNLTNLGEITIKLDPEAAAVLDGALRAELLRVKEELEAERAMVASQSATIVSLRNSLDERDLALARKRDEIDRWRREQNRLEDALTREREVRSVEFNDRALVMKYAVTEEALLKARDPDAVLEQAAVDMLREVRAACERRGVIVRKSPPGPTPPTVELRSMGSGLADCLKVRGTVEVEFNRYKTARAAVVGQMVERLVAELDMLTGSR